MFPNFKHVRARWSMQVRTVCARVFCRQSAVTALVIVEGALTAIPFLLSWWLCSLYRSVVAGWLISGYESNAKRSMLTKMLGGNADAG